MDEWLEQCLSRRAAGGLIVRGKNGSEHLLADCGSSRTERRHFFGLCPVCLSVGEHSACSGVPMSCPAFSCHVGVVYRFCVECSEKPELYSAHPPRLSLGLVLLAPMSKRPLAQAQGLLQGGDLKLLLFSVKTFTTQYSQRQD